MSTTAAPTRTLPAPKFGMSDDLWDALSHDRRTACAEHTAWADHCAHLHERADREQSAGVS